VTGELSLHGLVTAVGGIPEKLSAAVLHGRRMVIIPALNAAESAQHPELVEHLDVKPVHSFVEAMALAFDGSAGVDARHP
jgi:ATP-dependent Lon protease